MTSFFHGVEIVEVNEGFSSVKTLSSSVIGLIGVDKEADGEAFPLNKPVLLSSNKNEALSKLGKESVLHQSIEAIELQQCSQIVVIRVEEGETEEDTLKNLIGGIDPETGAYMGAQAFCGAESIVHVVPKILIAPGWFKGGTTDQTDPLLTALLPVAEKLKAIIIADGPNTNDEAALAAAKSANSERVYLVDPYVLNTAGEAVPASPYVAGVLSRVEEEKGFWFSPSNTPILGLTGLVRPVDFALGNANCRAQKLNEGNVATIIQHDGFRLFGNRSTSSDSKWQFLSVRRTADVLHDSLVRAHFWAVDRNLSKTYFDDVAERVNKYISELLQKGALLGGSCAPSKDMNSAANLANGHVYFDLEFTPTYPTERLTFRSCLVQSNLEEVL